MDAEVLEVHLDQSDLVDDLSNVVIHGIDNVPSDRVVKHVGLIQEGTEEVRLLLGVAGTFQENVSSIQGQVEGLTPRQAVRQRVSQNCGSKRHQTEGCEVPFKPCNYNLRVPPSFDSYSAGQLVRYFNNAVPCGILIRPSS